MTSQKRALIVGITGQDGHYLTELLLSKGYMVFGLTRWPKSPQHEAFEALFPEVSLIEGDLTSTASLDKALSLSQPNEVYNLAAISFLADSFKDPITTGEITALGTIRLLESIRRLDSNGRIRFYQASTSEMFGQPEQSPQDETTSFHPRSPYGAAKIYAYLSTVNYRESYGLFACSGILYNHESPWRGHEFVTRKITSSVARIKLGLQKDLALGNLDSRRDWGFAGDYVKGMWMMLQQPEPDDYVLATGETHSVREFVDLAFDRVGIRDWAPYVKTDPRFVRPPEKTQLLGNPAKAKRVLGWKPEMKLPELVRLMVDHDLDLEREHSTL